MSQGIFGIIDFESRISDPEKLAQSMSSFLGKSGDVGLSCVFDSHYILGMKRLSNGQSYQQAYFGQDEDRQTFCVVHGEIFNYSDLRSALESDRGLHGDIDLFLHLYKREGPSFAKKLNGLFSLAIMDMQNKRFIILNDRFGMSHQVYWTVVSDRLCFATHLRTLLLIPDVRREIDPEALNLFLKYSYIPSPWTIFKNINKLPPGHMLYFGDGKAEIQGYWEFPQQDNPVMDVDSAVEKYRALLRQSIERRVCFNGVTGILLSGGLDSSANVALAAQCRGSKIRTFSVGFDDPSFDEREYARIVSRHYGTEHFECTITGEEIEELPRLVWNLEEPYFEFGLFLTYLGLAASQREADAVIGGEGADQLFGTGGFAGGMPAALHYLFLRARLLSTAQRAARVLKADYFYAHDNKAFKARMLWDRAVDLNNWYFYGYDEHEMNLLHKDRERLHMPRIFINGRREPPASFAALYQETMVNQDLRHYANENVMVKAGRMADMLDINLRESYLDTEVTDFLVALDYPLKRSGGLFDHFRGRVNTKFLHRKAMEGLLPPEIMTKPKQGGFVPVTIFLKDKKMRNMLYYHLLNSAVMKEYFNLDCLRSIFAHYESVQGKKVYWHNFYNAKANRILFLLVFDLWHRFYIENDPGKVSPMTLSECIKK